jgi:hypothetical protein
MRLDWFGDRSKNVERDVGFGCRYFSPYEVLRPR